MSHLQKLTKICVTNREDTNNHKLKHFLNYLKGQTTNWFAKYETTHLATTWDTIKSRFSDVQSQRQVVATL
jgi:hypothetical protein